MHGGVVDSLRHMKDMTKRGQRGVHNKKGKEMRVS